MSARLIMLIIIFKKWSVCAQPMRDGVICNGVSHWLGANLWIPYKDLCVQPGVWGMRISSYAPRCLWDVINYPSCLVFAQNSSCIKSISYFVWSILLRKLTHWGRVTHICVNKLTIIGSDDGLSSGRCHAIIWTSAGLLLSGPLGTNFSEILIEFLTFSFTKMCLKVSSVKWSPFCLGLNVLTQDEIQWRFS